MTDRLSKKLSSHEYNVLAHAIRRIAGCWRISEDQVATILTIPASTSFHSLTGHAIEWSPGAVERGQYLVHLFDRLDTLMGGDDTAAVSWLQSINSDLGGSPIELIRSRQGLVAVAEYLDDQLINS